MKLETAAAVARHHDTPSANDVTGPTFSPRTKTMQKNGVRCNSRIVPRNITIEMQTSIMSTVGPVFSANSEFDQPTNTRVLEASYLRRLWSWSGQSVRYTSLTVAQTLR